MADTRTPETPARHDLASVLEQHQVEGRGMTFGAPDRCTCGAETHPEPGDEDATERRHRAFARHQALVVAVAGLAVA